MPRVLVTPGPLYQQPGPYRDALESAGLEVVFPPDGRSLMQPDILAAHLQGIDAVLAGMEPFTPEVLAGSKLRAIARMGVGYDAIDIPAASQHNVLITITPGTNEISVAEQALALLLGVFRGFPGRHQEVLSGVWRRKSLPRLAGKTIGLVGLGRIGRAMVPRAQGLGLKVIACDPLTDAQTAASLGIELCSFEDLLRTADIVSLHAPATPETTDMINARTLALMKPGSVLINTARGNLVDEDALADALRSRHLAAAGIDAFKIEPLPLDSPLLQLDNILLAPHMGGLDLESEVAMSHLAAKCIADLYRGQCPEVCVVNRAILPNWRW
jgi:D-3-phosphoglycerate dehydrogenase/(S)-sulfolactate dehydrogenase